MLQCQVLSYTGTQFLSLQWRSIPLITVAFNSSHYTGTQFLSYTGTQFLSYTGTQFLSLHWHSIPLIHWHLIPLIHWHSIPLIPVALNSSHYADTQFLSLQLHSIPLITYSLACCDLKLVVCYKRHSKLKKKCFEMF